MCPQKLNNTNNSHENKDFVKQNIEGVVIDSKSLPEYTNLTTMVSCNIRWAERNEEEKECRLKMVEHKWVYFTRSVNGSEAVSNMGERFQSRL